MAPAVLATECSVADCDNGGRYIRGLCIKHYHRWQRHGDPLTKLSPPGNRRGELNSNWAGDQVGYEAMHGRVRAVRGRAASYLCEGCGEEKADAWAYSHNDPSEKTSVDGPYSLDPWMYLPMCRSCHNTFDHRAHRGGSGD